MPIGVGDTRVDAQHIQDVGTEQGIGVTMHHVYTDALWSLASLIPNEGFQKGCVLPLTEEESDESSEESSAEEDDEGVEEDVKAEPARKEDGPYTEEVAEVMAEELADGIEGMEVSNQGMSSTHEEAEEGSEGAESEDDEEVELNPDELLEFSFMMALKKSVKDNKLPMLVSEFYASHLLPCRPAGSTLDIKKTSHKKIGKFLQAMGADRRIRLQDEKGTLSLLAINRKHDAYVSFRTGTRKTERDLLRAEAAEDAAGEASLVAKAHTAFRFGSAIKSFLPEGRDDSETMWSVGEAREILKQYIEEEGLNHPTSPGLIVLDAKLCDCLYALSKKEMKAGMEQEAFLTQDSKKNIFHRWDKQLELYHRLEGGGKKSTAWRKGPPPPVNITEVKVKGHNITNVVGLETYGIVPEDLASAAKQAFACTSNVTNLPGKNSAGKEVQLQGHLGARLLEHLHEVYGVERRCIAVKAQGKSKGKKH